ncbi:hypothetical protein [Methanosarcina mazei]|uniref:hypothetical protein n=1 Tax=Methanosarcina mazei TaxID=2209 RepID=UPI003C7959FA
MKLSAEEQEKMKLENYKMLSAISGKNLNDFIGNNDKNNYNDKDCKSKEIILNILYNPCTSKELFENIKNNGYDGKYKTVRSLLVRYQKAGFIKKLNIEKPIIYGLTEFGKENARNPKLLREENIRRYREFQLNKLKQLIEGQPEIFKSIYESIFGVQQNNIINSIVNNSSQYSDYDIGNKDDVIEEIRGKIEDKTFFTNVNEDKLESLVNGLLNDSLSIEEKKDLIMDALYNAANANKGSITIKTPEYQSSKPIGLRDYYEILIAAEGKVVTKSTYEALPFRFLKVGNELRLKGKGEVGTYRNNNDSKDLNFYEANAQYFNNRMIIKRIPNFEKREHEFYYSYGSFGKKITTISFDDYTKVKNNSVKTTLKINPAPKNN